MGVLRLRCATAANPGTRVRSGRVVSELRGDRIVHALPSALTRIVVPAPIQLLTLFVNRHLPLSGLCRRAREFATHICRSSVSGDVRCLLQSKMLHNHLATKISLR